MATILQVLVGSYLEIWTKTSAASFRFGLIMLSLLSIGLCSISVFTDSGSTSHSYEHRQHEYEYEYNHNSHLKNDVIKVHKCSNDHHKIKKGENLHEIHVPYNNHPYEPALKRETEKSNLKIIIM